MKKSLFIDFEKCTGCRSCEMACSLKSEHMCNSELARIKVMKWEELGLDVPMVCHQCKNPPCEAVCPKAATHRDEQTDAMVIDYDRCIGCQLCMLACPFGAINVDPFDGKVTKCNLCGGDPICVKFCETEAIRYITPDKIDYMRRRTAAQKLSEILTQHL